jgi:hypothetical protein
MEQEQDTGQPEQMAEKHDLFIHLRDQQMLKTAVHIPPKEQASNASKDAMIAAFQK